ncbi:hypothetical protein C4D60_Mb03t16600 [Musa balbisiana]|uniref:Uncharacterized protein n=1 Tax=Musa balbisiana TaxID=52838 RepID=A0A4S8JAG2_MUSBA|nr:hypothetical protein C4D60_Mb03t16600 [Musa balbisiana]
MASSSFHEEETDDGFVSAVRHESPQQIPAAPQCTQESLQLDDGGGDESEDDDDFEFAFVIKDPEGGQDITADEIFSDGQIRPVYPVFGRALLLADDDGLRRRGRATAELEEERATSAVRGTLRHLLIAEREENLGSSSSSSSLAADELAGVPPGTYCVWAPRSAALTPTRCKKSRSTGSSLRWRLRNLVVGRSHSDGKEKFVFLAAEEYNKKEKESRCRVPKTEETEKGKEEKAKGKRSEATEVDIATAHRIYYGSGSGARRSFLPYKQDLLGFFANVNGL